MYMSPNNIEKFINKKAHGKRIMDFKVKRIQGLVSWYIHFELTLLDENAKIKYYLKKSPENGNRESFNDLNKIKNSEIYKKINVHIYKKTKWITENYSPNIWEKIFNNIIK